MNIGQSKASLSIEPEEHPDDRRLRLRKDFILFCFGLAVVSIALLSCVYALLFGELEEAGKRLVVPLLSSILRGILGFFIRK